jgi:hypothetical protein
MNMRAALVVCLLGIVFSSCASAPRYPVYPPATSSVVTADFDKVFHAALDTLREDARLDLHTIDKAGRFIALEKPAGFIFFRSRTILDITLESAGPGETKIIMNIKAEDYEMGGLTREAGWYPSSEIDAQLGEDVMALIEQRVAQTS